MAKLSIGWGIVIAFLFTVVSSNHIGHDDKNCPMIGKFELESDLKTDEYEEYLKNMGYDDATRETMRSLKTVVVEISKNESTWTYTVNSRMKPCSQSFESGMEFEETLFDGRKVKSVVIVDEAKLTMSRTQKLENCEATQLLEFNNDELKATFTAHEKSVVLIFKRIKQAVFQLLMGR